MKRTVIVLAAAAWLAAALPAAAQDKAKGAALFTSQKCSLCHAVAGKGNAKGALDNVNTKLKADELKQWIVDPEGMRTKTKATRVPAMKKTKLTPAQVDDLVAYLASLKP